MKQLKQTFQKNCDCSGLHTFTQIRREGDVCLYSRVDPKNNNFLIGYELFVTRVIKAGTAMRGGNVEIEDREAYPGKSAFGHWAWFLAGPNGLERANAQFDSLVKGETPVEGDNDGTDEETTIEVIKVVSSTPIKEGLTLPEGQFSQKHLAAFNGIANYKKVYSDLQKMLARGIIKHGEKVESSRGKKTQLFVRV